MYMCTRQQQQLKLLLDVTDGDSLMKKSVEDAIVIIEGKVPSDHQCQYNKNPAQRKYVIIDLNTIDAMLTHNKLLTPTTYELKNQWKSFHIN